MNRIIAITLAFAAALSAPPAFATDRMNDIEYLRAVRCLAYIAGSPSAVIEGPQLAAEVDAQGRAREPYIRERARREGRSILREARRIDSDLEWQVFHRDLREACVGFEPMVAGLDPRA
jgi:hypothetical protein